MLTSIQWKTRCEAKFTNPSKFGEYHVRDFVNDAPFEWHVCTNHSFDQFDFIVAKHGRFALRLGIKFGAQTGNLAMSNCSYLLRTRD